MRVDNRGNSAQSQLALCYLIKKTAVRPAITASRQSSTNSRRAGPAIQKDDPPGKRPCSQVLARWAAELLTAWPPWPWTKRGDPSRCKKATRSHRYLRCRPSFERCSELLRGDATDPAVVKRLMRVDVARMVFTDEPFNVAIEGHVTGGNHREFVMASGEMTDAQFLEFNQKWMDAVLPYLVDGGILGTFIDWRGLPIAHAAATALGLTPLSLIVWAKTNAGMGSLYRSQHELLPLFKKGAASHVNNISLGKRGRHRTNLWTYPGASSLGSDARQGL